MICIYIAEPLVGLKRLASFGARGGGWCTIFPDWCKPGAEVGPGHFCASAGRCTETRKWCWKSFFLVLEIHFLVLEINFLITRDTGNFFPVGPAPKLIIL